VTPDTPELSAVVLCYMAGEGVRDVLDPLRSLLDASGIDYELVLVANYWPGRDDSTPEVVRLYAEADDRIRVVAGPKQGAMGWDMRSGFAAANGRHVVVIDGDAQNPVEDVLRIYRLLAEGNFDVMKGRRAMRYDGFYRRVISFGYNVLFRILFGTWQLWDINGKPKALTRRALESMKLRSDDWFIDAEIVLESRRLGLRLGEMPVVFNENPARESFVRLSAVAEFLGNMFRRRVRRS
jgi:glycosyltransferase involved in cell wall biosynthesis